MEILCTLKRNWTLPRILLNLQIGNMRVNKLMRILAVILLLVSCNKGSERNTSTNNSSHKLFKLEQQGWKSQRITHFANDIHYSATEVPNEYYLLKNKGINNLSQIDSLSKAYDRERIIEFEFEHIGEDDLLQEGYTTLDYDRSV